VIAARCSGGGGQCAGLGLGQRLDQGGGLATVLQRLDRGRAMSASLRDGELSLQIHQEGQQRFPQRARILAFNPRQRHRRQAIADGVAPTLPRSYNVTRRLVSNAFRRFLERADDPQVPEFRARPRAATCWRVRGGFSSPPPPSTCDRSSGGSLPCPAVELLPRAPARAF